jgi:hypothetical protein
MGDWFWFDTYAKKRLGKFTLLPFSGAKCVEVCIAAMESGDLPVCSRNSNGDLLWSTYCLTIGDWIRICRLRPPLELVWAAQSKILFSCTGDFADAYDVAELRTIDYLWQDLQAVQAFAACHGHVSWISQELALRVSWSKQLRRAWIAAVVTTV